MTNLKEEPIGGCWRPFLAISCSIPVQFIMGTMVGQSAGMLPQLLAPDSYIHIDREQATWIASIPVIGTLLTSCICGRLADLFGRIRMLQIFYFFFATGHGVMIASTSFNMLLIGRFLIGLGGGFSFPSLVYLGETSPPAWRSFFLSTCPLSASLGLVFMYTVGGYLPWIVASQSICIASILGFISLFFWYDSPQWLVSKNKTEDALRSLKRIEYTADVTAKLKELQDIAAAQALNNPSISLKTFGDPTVWKPFFLILLISIIQNSCGFYIVVYYTVNFMDEFHTDFDSLQVTCALGTTRFFATILATYLLRRIGRKTIGAISGFSSAALLFIIFGYLTWETGNPELAAKLSWIPVSAFVLFMITSGIGIYILPWVMPYEVFPIRVRGMMCGAAFATMYLFMFTFVKSYNILVDNLGIQGMVLMFAISALIFGICSMTILVETHNRSLDEIEQEFSGKKRIETKTSNEV